MLYKKILIILQLLPILFATSHNEAKLRCEKFHEQTKKNANEIQNHDLSNTANQALNAIQTIITNIEKKPAKDLPQQVKRCMDLSDCVVTLKNELSTISEKDLKKEETKKSTKKLSETITKNEKKHHIDPEQGAIDLSKKLKEIAKEVSGNSDQKQDTNL